MFETLLPTQENIAGKSGHTSIPQRCILTFDVHLTVHRDKFLTIKPTRCTNFSNLFLKWNSTCFGQFLCPSPGVFHCTHSIGICNTLLLTACEQDQDIIGVPSWSCSQAVSKPVWHIPMLCAQWETPDDGQRDCQKHVEFYFKNKFEKLLHLVGFIIRKFMLNLNHSVWKINVRKCVRNRRHCCNPGNDVRLEVFNPLNPELNPICYFWHY